MGHNDLALGLNNTCCPADIFLSMRKHITNPDVH